MPDEQIVIEQIPIDKLKPWPGNPRVITEEQLQSLMNSIKEFGFVEPVIVRPSDQMVIGGHQRLKAAEKLGMTTVPVVYREYDDNKVKMLNVALNRISGSWDYPVLATLLVELDALSDVDVTLTGFTVGEIKELQAEYIPPKEGLSDPDAIPEPPGEAITKRGEQWLLGAHRLLCGDSGKAEDVLGLMNGRKANLLMTSPPYWVGMEYEREKSQKEVNDFISLVVNNWIKAVDVNNSRIVINTGMGRAARAFGETAETLLLLDWWKNALKEYDWLLRHCRAWIKSGGIATHSGRSVGPNADIIDQHWEFIATFYNPKGKHRGMNRTNAPWVQQGCWEFRGAAREAGHVASFPVELPLRIMMLYGKQGEIVFEPFCGAGTTIIAAEQMGRACYAMDLVPLYCDIAVSRWMQFTGKEAYLDGKHNNKKAFSTIAETP